MSEEVRIVQYNNNSGRDEERVMAWEDGLPCLDDLTPLSQALIPPELASAFRITAEQPRTVVEVNRASKNTITSIRGQLSAFEEASYNYSTNNVKSYEGDQNQIVVDDDEVTPLDLNLDGLDGLDSRKVRRIEGVEDYDMRTDETNNNNQHNGNNSTASIMSASNDEAGSGKSSKRPRLVWTPQLHKRFVEVVGHLGIKNAVPKTIMQLMNVEGLTRENVASHLQKYRLYLKRMQGLSDEGPSASDHLFASTPVPQSLQESSGGNVNGSSSGQRNGHHGQHQSSGNEHIGMIPMPYPPQMMHMPYIGMMPHGHGHVGLPHGNGYHGYEANHHQYSMMQNKFGSFPQYHNHVAPNDN